MAKILLYIWKRIRKESMAIHNIGSYQQSPDVRQKLDNHLGNLNKLQKFQAQRYLAVKQTNLYNHKLNQFQKLDMNV